MISNFRSQAVHSVGAQGIGGLMNVSFLYIVLCPTIFEKLKIKINCKNIVCSSLLWSCINYDLSLYYELLNIIILC